MRSPEAWTPGRRAPLAASALALCLCGPLAGADSPIWGYADLHSHQFSNLGFGGALFQGAAFDPDDRIERALAHCDFDAAGTIVDSFGRPLTPIPGFGDAAHGPGGVGDLVGAASGQGFGHAVGGYPEFDGWPRWNTRTHQQMYYEWLERAYRGGLRLLVMLAVNNKLLCVISNQRRGFGCNDMDAVDRQLAAARELEAFIDEKHGGPGQGWYRIVLSGAEARRVIEDGKLAVVLGMEVDDLFDCVELGDGCTPEYVREQLARYHALGVRHLFPVHLFDNAFGGAAIGDDVFNFGNRILNGSYFEVADCARDGYDYRLGASQQVTPALVSLLLESPYIESLFGEIEPPPEYAEAAHCNARGLTPLGEVLIREMMARRMIIDIDHMSKVMTDQALGIAEETGYPVVSGHSGFLETFGVTHRAERGKNAEDVERVRRLGGIFAPILHQGDLDRVQPFGNLVPHDCGSSSTTLAQVYLYIADAMRGGAVAFGSDFNGFAGEPRPRFGDEGCAAQRGGVEYPFQVHGEQTALDRSVAGDRVFDFNTDGLAHVGLVPDLVEDLRSVLPSDDLLDPLFRSAEAYVRLWERIDAGTHAPCFTPRRAAGSIATGIDDATRRPTDDGLSDDNWIVVGPDGSGFGEACAAVIRRDRFPVGPAGPWNASGDRSRWIGVSTPEARGGPGVWTFRVTVRVEPDGGDETPAIAGRWTSDGPTLDVLVNGVSAGITGAGDVTRLEPFPDGAGAGLFRIGDNVVEFLVGRDGDGLQPVGLRLEARIGAPSSSSQRPGDCNQDRVLDISDASCLFGHLFLGSPENLPCDAGSAFETANVTLLDHNGDSAIDISDGVAMLQFLFAGGAPPALGTECVEIDGCRESCAP